MNILSIQAKMRIVLMIYTLFFLNAYKDREYQTSSTEEIIDKEQSISRQIGDITKVQTL